MSSCRTESSRDISFPPAFRLGLRHWLSLGAKPAGLRLGLGPPQPPGSPACRLQVLGLVSLQKHTCQFLAMNLYLSIHPIGSVSGELLIQRCYAILTALQTGTPPQAFLWGMEAPALLS